MSKTHTVRLSDADCKSIDEFLTLNPFFDFSSLARTAIVEFIKAPTLQIQPIKQTLPPKRTLKPASKELYHD